MMDGSQDTLVLESQTVDGRVHLCGTFRSHRVRPDSGARPSEFAIQSTLRFEVVRESRARLGRFRTRVRRGKGGSGADARSTLAMASEAEEKARRVRSLLSSYYGSSGDAPFASGARVPAEPIDAPDFDAERYVRETLERTPLDALRKKCASMREEARRLDGDAQTLVYDNYSTFIAAADAVSDVRVKAHAMEEKMAEAKALIARTVTKAEAVDQNLSARRDTVLALSGVRNLIQKLRRAFDVPEKMRAALDRGAPSAAAHYYAAVRPLLAKHGDRGAFVAVKRLAEVEAARARSEIGEAMARAATRADEGARARRTAERGEAATIAEDFGIAPMDATENPSMNPSTNPSTTVGAPNAFEPEHRTTSLNLSASECVALLAKLGAARGESRAAFVRSHRAPMERALALGESSVSSPAGRAAIHADPRAFVARLDGDFLEAFHRFAGEYLEVFGDDEDEDASRDARGELVDAGRPLFARYFALVKLALDAAETAETAETSRCDAASSRLVQTRHPKLVPAKGLMAALATMAADLSSAHRLVPRLGLGDRAAEVVERAVRGRVRAAFHALETKLVRALDELETVASLASESRLGIPSEVGASVKNTFGAARETAALRETLARVAAVFAGGVAEALADARALLEERPVMVMGWRAEFEGLVRAESQTVVRAMLARLTAAGVASGACGAPPPKALRVESDDRSPLAEAARRGRNVSADVSATDSETADGVVASRRAESESIDGSRISELDRDRDPSFDPLFALACARTAAFVRDEGVDAIAAQLDLCFPPRDRDRDPDASTCAVGTSDDEPESAASRARADEAALFLAAAFARARGDAAAATLRRTMRTVDWAEAREPRDVRPVADVLLEEMARVDAEAGAILSLSFDGSDVASTLSETGDKIRNIRKHSEVGTEGFGFVPRSCARAAVTVSVVRFVLRAFSEMLSATPRFSRGGFHQTELDLAFLKPRLVAWGAAASPADAKAVDDLLSECVAAAAARTVDPAPLDSAIVARILDAKQSRGGG